MFTIESSNNHALMTLWIRIVGDQGTFFVYRLPSLVAGLACIPLAARIAGRSGRSAAIAAAWIVALSFLSIVFSSEARGYALLVACSLAAFESAWTWIDRGDRRWLAASWAFALVGVLSQTLFVLSWAAIATAVIVRIFRQPGDRRLARIVAFGAVPIAIFATWWFVNVRHVFNAGAPPWELATVVTRALAWRTGLPVAEWALIVGAAMSLGVLALDVRRSVRGADPTWIVQVCMVLVVPVATAAILWDEYLAPRYFLVPLAFWCLSFARVIADFGSRSRMRRVLALLVFAAFAVGNLRYVVGFVRAGRGHVGDLVEDMAARATTRQLVVTGNYDFNVGAQIAPHTFTRGRRAACVVHRSARGETHSMPTLARPT